ncbi:hypothetical protein AJ87_40810 [Rhizobium yanglingense]|nr:hypothetical protein AJ87_40810 [Rhizobium yanglingense]
MSPAQTYGLSAWINALLAKQSQPFPHKHGASFWRVSPIAGRLVGGTHGARLVEVETSAIAVAIGGIVEGGAYFVTDYAIESAP